VENYFAIAPISGDQCHLFLKSELPFWAEVKAPLDPPKHFFLERGKTEI